MGYGSLSTVTLANARMASGTDVTRWVSSEKEYGDAASLGIASPTGLEANTYTIEVTNNDLAGTGGAVPADDIFTLQAGTPLVDVVAPLALKAAVYDGMLNWKYFRINSSANVGADRDFKLSKQIVLQ